MNPLHALLGICVMLGIIILIPLAVHFFWPAIVLIVAMWGFLAWSWWRDSKEFSA